VEKPFTVVSEEAEQLIRLAEANGKKITVGHDTQFVPVAREMRSLIRSGYLGGAPVHMESVYCYDLGDARYARALLADNNHWVRRLPGGLLHNIISHGIGKIVEYLQDGDVSLSVQGSTSRLLRRMGETNIVDELRVLMSDGHGTTAYFTFSSQMKPSLHQFRVYGPRNGLIADHLHQTLIRIPKNYVSYLNQFVPPLGEASQHLRQGLHNAWRFMRKKLHSSSGMYSLINWFYESMNDRRPLPVPYPDIILTSRIMDAIFELLRSQALGVRVVQHA